MVKNVEPILCLFLINLRPTILPSLSISSGGSRPSDKGGGAQSRKKNFFQPFGTNFGLKLRGAGPLDPLLINSLFFRYIIKLLKATQKGKKSIGVFEVVLGNQTQDISARRPRTNQLC